jgi:hypothetical protein
MDIELLCGDWLPAILLLAASWYQRCDAECYCQMSVCYMYLGQYDVSKINTELDSTVATIG